MKIHMMKLLVRELNLIGNWNIKFYREHKNKMYVIVREKKHSNKSQYLSGVINSIKMENNKWR